jgi:hypothetical protein
MNKTEKKIKYEGELPLGNYKIPCYVLEDGTRVLSGNQMQEALKLFPDNTVIKSGSRLARLLNYKVINELIVNKFEVGHFDPIICYKGNTKINGFEATLLADICEIMLEIRKNPKINLTKRQEIIADQCEILVRSFAKVGIIALVDEATGYQYDREKLELQAILKLFISEEILEWQRTFQLSFYKEIFRLWKIPFTPENIKNKPIFIGKFTKDYVYRNMPKGYIVFEKLKEKTPKTKTGNYKVRLHQSLTKEIGREALLKVISSIETLAAISDSKIKFKRLVQERYGQKEIPFEEFDIDFKAPHTKIIDNPTGFDKLLSGIVSVPPENNG